MLNRLLHHGHVRISAQRVSALLLTLVAPDEAKALAPPSASVHYFQFFTLVTDHDLELAAK
jgi:hypothetical protein